MPSYADVHDCILTVRRAGTKNFNGMLVYLGVRSGSQGSLWELLKMATVRTIVCSIYCVASPSVSGTGD